MEELHIKDFESLNVIVVDAGSFRNNISDFLTPLSYLNKTDSRAHVVVMRYGCASTIIFPPNQEAYHLIKEHTKKAGRGESIDSKIMTMGIPLISVSDFRDNLTRYLKRSRTGMLDDSRTYTIIMKHQKIDGVLIPPQIGYDTLQKRTSSVSQ